MPFLKDFTAPNGATLTYHKLTRLEGSAIDGAINVMVASWPTEADCVAGKPQLWSSYFSIPLDQAFITSLQEAILLTPDFGGASTIPEATGTLEAAKERKWAEMKEQRSRVEYGGFEWNTYTFNSDAISQGRITGAVVLAILAENAGQPFSQDWTLADNSVIPLDGPAMMSVGAALGTHVGGTHAAARLKRSEIDAATTIEEVEAITWDTQQ